MKKKLIVLSALALAAIGVIAADLTYTTLPQDTDSALVIANKEAAVLTGASNKFVNITTAGTTAVKVGSGVLEALLINTAGSSGTTATIYDAASATNPIGSLTTVAQGAFRYNCRFGTALTIVTAGTTAPNLTVVYR